MTTFEPGARLVLTHGLRVRPFAAALRASRPAPIMTAGFDVFVQLVIAAITTAPSSRSNFCVAGVTGAFVPLPAVFNRSPILAAGDFQRDAILRALRAREARLDGR